jgi:hypothetical protein
MKTNPRRLAAIAAITIATCLSAFASGYLCMVDDTVPCKQIGSPCGEGRCPSCGTMLNVSGTVYWTDQRHIVRAVAPEEEGKLISSPNIATGAKCSYGCIFTCGSCQTVWFPPAVQGGFNQWITNAPPSATCWGAIP